MLLITAMAAAMNFGPFKSWLMEFPEVVSFCENTLEESLGWFLNQHVLCGALIETKARANQKSIS